MKKYDLLAIGSIAIEFNIRANDGLLKQHNLQKGLGTLVTKEHFNDIIAGQKIEERVAGGAIVNVSLGIKMRGGKAAVIGKIANDHHGLMFKKGVKSKGLDYMPVISTCHNSHTTSIATIITPDKERTFAAAGYAAYEITPDEIDEKVIEQAKLVYLDSYIWYQESGKNTAHYAARTAKQSGAKVAMSLNGADIIAENHHEFISLAKQHADILVGDKREFMCLFGTTTLEDTFKALEKTKCIASITDGANGAYIVNKGKAVHIPAKKVENIVDTCGAGDQFAAGFLYGIINHKTPEESGHLGAEWASEAIQHVGPHPQKPANNNTPTPAKGKKPNNGFKL